MEPSDVRLAKMVMAGLSHRNIADALNCSVYALGDRIYKLKRTLGVQAGAKITPEILEQHQEHSSQSKPTDPRGGVLVEYSEREITDLERRTELNAQALTPCLPNELMNICCGLYVTSFRSAVPFFWVGRACLRSGCAGRIRRVNSLEMNDYGPEAA